MPPAADDLGASLGVALQNARLVEETRQRAAELTTVNQIGTAAASQLDVATLIELVGERARVAFEADIAYVALLDAATARSPSRTTGSAARTRPGSARPRRGAHIADPHHGRAAPAQPRRAFHRARDPPDRASQRGRTLASRSRRARPRSASISVQSTQDAGRFGEADERLLSTIAANVGTAIQNARLYRGDAPPSRRDGRVRRRRARDLGHAGPRSRAPADRRTGNGPPRRGYQRGVHARAGWRRVPRDRGTRSDSRGDHGRPDPSGRGDHRRPRRQGAAEFVNDVAARSASGEIPGTEDVANERIMAAPLIGRDGVSGLLAVWRSGPSDPFSQADLDFLVGLSQQAAIAIENARLFADPQDARRGGRAGEPGQELVPGRDEPRDPHADERDHRDERPARSIRRSTTSSATTPRRSGRSGDALLTIINDILDFSKIEAGRVDLEARPFDLQRRVEGALDVLAPTAAAKGIELAYTIADDLPAASSATSAGSARSSSTCSRTRSSSPRRARSSCVRPTRRPARRRDRTRGRS